MKYKFFSIVSVTIICISSYALVSSIIHDDSPSEHGFNDICYPVKKDTPFEDYTNDEVRQAIMYCCRYSNNKILFMLEHPDSWVLWLDYESRVSNASYMFWVISYAFNV